jgi:hypothetical protein
MVTQCHTLCHAAIQTSWKIGRALLVPHTSLCNHRAAKHLRFFPTIMIEGVHHDPRKVATGL